MGWTGLEADPAPRVEGVSQACHAVASAGEGGKAPDTPPIRDTLDRSLDRSKGVDVALAEALAKAAGRDCGTKAAFVLVGKANYVRYEAVPATTSSTA